MAEPTDIISAAGAVLGGGALAWKVVEWFLAARLKKADQLEEDAETEKDTKLDAIYALVQRLDREFGTLSANFSHYTGTVNEVKGRIDGMSENYGKRLSQVERDMVELRTLLTARRRK